MPYEHVVIGDHRDDQENFTAMVMWENARTRGAEIRVVHRVRIMISVPPLLVVQFIIRGAIVRIIHG